MKKFFSNLINTLPKRIAASAMLAMAVVLPVATSAAQAVKIEATTGVANVTAGDTTYKSSVNASYDQEVKVQVTYNNKEDAGSNKVANNLRVKIGLPTKAGKSQTITTTTSGDNTNTVNGSVKVNLDRDDAYLQYELGSVVWKHADQQTGKVVTKELKSAGDAIVGANGLVLENEKPCQAGSVTIRARVMIPGVEIVKQSKVKGGTDKWSNKNTARPGDTLSYLISYKNTGNTVQHDVIIRDSLPPHMTLVPGTTKLANATYPQGKAVASNDVVNGGIIIGNYGAGANAFVTFDVKIDDASKLSCGENEFGNVGVAHPKELNEYYNTAFTKVTKTCEDTPETPVYTCDLLTVNKLGGREIEAKVDYTAENGAKLKTVTYDFGDNSTPLTTDKTSAKYTYAKDGDYNVTAELLFSVDGKDKTVSSDSCAKPVSFTTPTTPETPETPGTPEELPNTGAGNVIALFAAASVAGAVAHRLFLARRLAQRS
jgi:uncharacterized repeat protein (TIGR01451 family)